MKACNYILDGQLDEFMRQEECEQTSDIHIYYVEGRLANKACIISRQFLQLGMHVIVKGGPTGRA